ncbi:hypothetical protein [Geobacillus icigianus]|uniref:Uncharacterized protein n=1 Tax=Geobacillus icigianus TaxID=1430331 RepID=A0ABU6BBW4_9BACL|nr:hypothetical protein [Geobacillus icigianus]MEB3749193.1 hypothetical protein [Geobacillus icigianus]
MHKAYTLLLPAKAKNVEKQRRLKKRTGHENDDKRRGAVKETSHGQRPALPQHRND